MVETLLWWCFIIAVPSFVALCIIMFLVESKRRAKLKRQATNERRKGSRSE